MLFGEAEQKGKTRNFLMYIVLGSDGSSANELSLDLKFNPWDTAITFRLEWRSMSKTVFTQYDPFESWCTEQSDVWLGDVTTLYHRPCGVWSLFIRFFYVVCARLRFRRADKIGVRTRSRGRQCRYEVATLQPREHHLSHPVHAAICRPDIDENSSMRKLKLLRENKEMSIMLNNWRRCLYSSRVHVSLIRMSASWLQVSTYLTWIMGSRLILSNSQSRDTLWVRETCLISGLLPLTIILISASLSSTVYIRALWWESFPFVAPWSISFQYLISDVGGFNLVRIVGCFSHYKRITTGFSVPVGDGDGCKTWIPESHGSRDITSDPVELCDTAACFLHIQLIGTKVRRSKNAQKSSWCRVCTVLQCFPHDHIACNHSCYQKLNDPSVCHKLSSTLWLLEQTCSPTTEYHVCRRAPNIGISE